MTWNLSDAVAELRTPTGLILAATAATGMAVALFHLQLMLVVMMPAYLVVSLVPRIARWPQWWAAHAVVWGLLAIVRRHDFEDHVYVYVAWLVAITLCLLTPDDFMAMAEVHGRRMIATVFGFATLWKLVSGDFITGSALWTSALFDDRFEPAMRLIGISPSSLDAARPEVERVLLLDGTVTDISLSGYSSIGLYALAIGTLLLEASIAATHAAPDGNRLAGYRAPTLIGFGLLTYSVVPVVAFAMILAVMEAPGARGDRRIVGGLVLMVTVATVRFALL